MLNRAQVIEMIKGLNLPESEYWLVAGTALVVHGVREFTNDIDLSCTSDLFDKLEKNAQEVKVLDDNTRKMKFNDEIEIFENWLVDKIDIIDGIPVGSLESIKKHKLKLGREKDFKDIELIDAFLNKRTNQGLKSL